MSEHICGWCITGHHDTCKPELVYYEKVWYCHCEKCKDKQNDKKDKNEKSNSQDILSEPPTDLSARTENDGQESEPIESNSNQSEKEST